MIFKSFLVNLLETSLKKFTKSQILENFLALIISKNFKLKLKFILVSSIFFRTNKIKFLKTNFLIF